MSEQNIGSSGLLPEVEVKIEELVTSKAEVLGIPSNYHSGSATAGPRSRDLILKVTGWNFRQDYPAQVFCQARQNRNQNLDFGWSDQFVIQVIETSRTFVRIRIRRIDDGVGSSGWGQNLRIDIFVID